MSAHDLMQEFLAELVEYWEEASFEKDGTVKAFVEKYQRLLSRASPSQYESWLMEMQTEFCKIAEIYAASLRLRRSLKALGDEHT